MLLFLYSKLEKFQLKCEELDLRLLQANCEIQSLRFADADYHVKDERAQKRIAELLQVQRTFEAQILTLQKQLTGSPWNCFPYLSFSPCHIFLVPSSRPKNKIRIGVLSLLVTLQFLPSPFCFVRLFSSLCYFLLSCLVSSAFTGPKRGAGEKQEDNGHNVDWFLHSETLYKHSLVRMRR